MIAAWWQALAPNERRMLGIGTVIVVVLLGWALLWHPLAAKRAELEQNVENQRRDLAYVRLGAAEVEKLRSAGTRSRADRQGKSLLALADATARAAGLDAALKRVEPVGARSVRVSFEAANFDALVQWIEGLSKGYGVEASDLSADRADGIGLVNARVTLQEAP
ncbi:type II secretion system protein M [Dokdonella soli]|uniref:Type II secretion system protein M n=1 Tax=Dokdonella soli TaxID=529810 RepID=A0ABP3U182_9GAMM